MKKKILLTPLMALVFTNTATGKTVMDTSTTSGKIESFSHDFDSSSNAQETLFNISYQVPGSWSRKDAKNGYYYHAKNGMLYTYADDSPVSMGDTELQDNFIEGFRSSVENYQEKDRYTTTINNVDTLVLEFEGFISGKLLNGKYYIFSDAEHCYGFVFSDYSGSETYVSHMKDFEEIVKTISFSSGVKNMETKKEETPKTETVKEEKPEESKKPEIPIEYKNALRKAEIYNETMPMSKQGLYDQLTSEYGEKFSPEAAQYAVDNVKADWNANALAKAKDYSEQMHMSKAGIYNQLISENGEKFTAEEAQYAVDNVDADWNANALEKAKSYQDSMAMSPDAIRDQLTSEHGEKFTAEEADYAIQNLE